MANHHGEHGSHPLDELRAVMGEHANHLERVDMFMRDVSGGGRTEAMIIRALEDAALYMLRLEAEYCGSSITDGLRGI